jgi:hypothetical protein
VFLFAAGIYQFAGCFNSIFLIGLCDTGLLALATQSLADLLLESLEWTKKSFLFFFVGFVFFCFLFFVFFLFFLSFTPE